VKASGIVTLTTDFGISDPYVGMMKGVILSINPLARIVDISHEVKAGSILQACSLILESYPFFSKGTVHVAVVDPGVGSERRLILLKARDHFFVGPDNGIFWPLIASCAGWEAIHLTRSEYFLPNLSHTFHGRDIFAPVAAHLSNGVEPLEMGAPIDDPVKINLPEPIYAGDTITAQVIRVDHFGNLITNVHKRDLDRFLEGACPLITLGELKVEGISRTYADARAGDILALIGSSGLLEVAVNLGRASDRVGLNSEDIIGTRLEIARA
jgi:S-adenosyl-L-methionine hydrolase (adenosine-forming)